ncbi:hypothetical protein THAOC_31866, partial [Thalassiosira oceanica]
DALGAGADALGAGAGEAASDAVAAASAAGHRRRRGDPVGPAVVARVGGACRRRLRGPLRPVRACRADGRRRGGGKSHVPGEGGEETMAYGENWLEAPGEEPTETDPPETEGEDTALLIEKKRR